MPFYQVYADAGDFSIKNRSGRRQHAAVVHLTSSTCWMGWLMLLVEGVRHLVACSKIIAATDTVQKKSSRVVQADKEPLLTFSSYDICDALLQP